MGKVRVPVAGTIGKSVSINPRANEGAQIGVDLFMPDGSVATIEQLAALFAVQSTAGGDPVTGDLSPTVWGLIGEIPPNITEAAALNSVGILVRQTDGSWITRSIAAGSSKVTVTNGDGDAGAPTIDVVEAAIDHGAISGLGDNDHPQYALLTGASFSGAVDVTGGLTSTDGGLTVDGTGTTTDTPVGSAVPSMVDIPSRDLSAFEQQFAVGIGSGSHSSSRVFSVFDQRGGAHQPSIAVFSPDESDAFGFSWEGSNSAAYIKSLAANIALRIDETDIMAWTPTLTYVYTDLDVDGDVTADNLNVANWDTAFGWGNHASAGYITSVSGGDHGALSGLSDNDHPQYALLTGPTFTGSVNITNTSPTLYLFESDAGTDEKQWAIHVNNDAFQIWTRSDSNSFISKALAISRTGTTVDEIELNAALVDINGPVDIAGALTATTYGGITEANLVDKSATETITGLWNFSTFDLLASSGFSVQGIATDQGQTGQIAFIDVNGGVARFGSYDWDAGAFQPMNIAASTLSVTPPTTFTNGVALENSGNASSILTIGKTTLAGNSNDGQLRLYGENAGVVYGATLTMGSSNLFLQGTTAGGATAAATLLNYLTLQCRAGASFAMYDSAEDSNVTYSHDGTDFKQVATGIRLQRFHGQTHGIAIQSDGGGAGLYQQEQSAATQDFGGWGQIWVKNDTPNTLWFTDDAGTDFQLGVGGSSFDPSDDQTITGEWEFKHTNGILVIDGSSTDYIQLAVAGNQAQMNVSGVTDLRIAGAPLYVANPLYLAEFSAASGDTAGRGQLWVKDDTPNTLWFTDDAGNDVQLGVGSGAEQTKYKTADQSKTSNTTLADDTHLAGFTLEAGAYYKIQGYIQVETGSITPDLKTTFQFSNAPQSGHIRTSITLSTSEATQTNDDLTSTLTFQIAAGGEGTAFEFVGHFLANAATGGTVDFQWAQNTSNGNAMTLKKGSWITITKIS